MIICLRTVHVPPDWRERYLAWIAAGREIRQQHGILAELVCQPSDGTGDTVVITAWPSHEIFDAWIATPHRDALTASDVHQAVTYHPITRYDVPGGYLNLPGLTHPRPQPTDPPSDTRGVLMKWITRARPKTDRIACPWLIRRFIDTAAQIVYVPADEVLATTAAAGEACSFDAPEADYTHQLNPAGGEWCTFETLIAEFHLATDPALARLATIVHAADIAADLYTDPLGPGLQAIGLGGLDVETDDHQLLARGMFVYDALYAWCAQQVAATAATPA